METQLARTNGDHTIAARAADVVQSVRITPPIDVYENPDEFLLLADMPGVQAADLDVKLDPPLLHVRGRQLVGPVPVEYQRAIRVDERIDPDAIEATLDSGVLRVVMKKRASFKPKRIEIKRS